MDEVEEQRVVAALRALTGGITVTEMDTLESHAELKARLGPPSPRRRIAVALTAAAAVVAAVLVVVQTVDRDGPPAPADPPPAESAEDELRAALEEDAYQGSGSEFLAGEAPTRQDLAGLWLLRQPFDFSVVMDSGGGWFAGSPAWLRGGRYTLEGDTFVRRIDDSVCHGSTGRVPSTSWRASIAPDASLRLEFTGVENVCTPADDREVYDRVWPGPSPVGDFLRDSIRTLEWEQARTSLPAGVYIAPETGRMLAISLTGRYHYYDQLDDASDPAPADRGRLDEDAEPGVLSGTCRGGAFTGTLQADLIPEVDGITADLYAVRVVGDTGGGCTSGVGDQTVWVRLLDGF